MNKEDQFVKVIQEYEAIIFKISSVYAQEGYEQQDLYQDIIAQLWKAFDHFREDSKISTWIYRVALNTAISSVRKIKKKNPQHQCRSACLTIF